MTTVGKTSITRWSSRCPKLMKGTRKRLLVMGAKLTRKICIVNSISGLVLATPASFGRSRSRGRQNRRAAAPGLLAGEKRCPEKPRELPLRRRPQDRRLVRLAQDRRGEFRRRGGRVPQHQHARGAGQGMSSIQQTVSCLDDYDPNALRVDKANEAIRACLSPVTQTERIRIRDALGRVLAQDIVPTINVPSHDNSAMDGYAVRFSDLTSNETVLTEVG